MRAARAERQRLQTRIDNRQGTRARPQPPGVESARMKYQGQPASLLTAYDLQFGAQGNRSTAGGVQEGFQRV